VQSGDLRKETITQGSGLFMNSSGPMRKPGRSHVIFSNLVLEVIEGHFCLILLIRSQSLRPACIHGKGNWTPPFEVRRRKDFQYISKPPYLLKSCDYVEF
jgi:hypothetical protein